MLKSKVLMTYFMFVLLRPGSNEKDQYMAVRLSDIISKGPKNTKKTFFACFRAYFGQPHGHIGISMMHHFSQNSVIIFKKFFPPHEKVQIFFVVVVSLIDRFVLGTRNNNL